MRRGASRLIGALAALLVAPAVQAQAVAKVDPRALAVGGGYVAVADGWAALQWNPAGLWVSGRNEAAAVFGSVPLEGGPWVESLRVATGLPGTVDPATAQAALSSPGAGLAAERALGVYIVSTRFGGAAQEVTYVDELSRADPQGLEIDQVALRAREYQLSVAHPLMQGRVAIGASAKLVQAQGRLQSVPLVGLTAADLSARELVAAARSAPPVAEQTLFSVDVGVLVMAGARVRVGGVVKNLNAPELDAGSQTLLRLPRQIRVGGLLLPHPTVKLSLDLDLTADSFVAGGRERRELGGGVEWALDAVALRGGMFVDLSAMQRRSTYTFGLGVGGDPVRVDFAGSWARERDGFGIIGALAAEF